MSIFARRARRGRRRRVRRSHWWSEAPWWAWILMIVGAAGLAVATTLAIQRGQAPATSDVASERPTVDTLTRDTRIVVIGDAGGGPAPAAWPTLLQQRLDDASVETFTADGAGYVTANAFGRTIGGLAAAAPTAGADLVVISGGRADGAGVAGQVSDAARAMVTDLRAAAPDAVLVVIGPAWPAIQTPAAVQNNRDAIRDAVAGAGATFIDPLSEGWLTDRPGLIAPDGVHLTERGQQYLADLIEPIVRQAIVQ